MIQRIAQEYDINDFITIYNSANELYPENWRYPADSETFKPQLKRDENYMAADDDGRKIAFFSYYKHPSFYELTSLYVMHDIQRSGLGSELLSYFEGLVPAGEFIFVKALKSSPWAIQFYRKHGYAPLSDSARERLSAFGWGDAPLFKESAHSILLFKQNCPAL